MGGFNALYAAMGALAAVVAIAALFLPSDRAVARAPVREVAAEAAD
jgi:hypothetical protein